MFGLSKEEKKRAATRERVRRYREKQKGVTSEETGVTENVTPPSTPAVTPSGAAVVTPQAGATKMLCKCLYFTWKDGRLVCSQCGKPSQHKNIGDKIHRAEVK